MNIYPSKYQSSIFCDLVNIKPETQLIQSLFSQLVTWNVFPNIVKELTLDITQFQSNSINKSPLAVDRMQFISSDRKKRINLLTNKIDIEIYDPNPLSYTIQNFYDDTVNLASAILKILNKKANRLSLVTSYFNRDNPLFFDLNDNILSNTSIQIDGQPLTLVDWDQRFTYNKIVAFNERQEQLNLNVFLGKNGIHNQPNQGFLFNRFELTFDINTNLNTYDTEDIILFYKESFKISEELKTNILARYLKK